MNDRRLAAVVAGWLCVVAALGAGPATSPATTRAGEPTKFMRWVGDARGGKLESAIVTYRNKAGARVDLVSAIHVGDKAYYAVLDRLFAGYDAVLYEMVKPAGMEEMPAPGEREDSPVSTVQRMIQDMLGLEFQLDRIDYRAKNFVHADLDVETFSRMQEERGESLFVLMLQTMMNDLLDPQAGARQGGRLANMTLPELLAVLTSPDRPTQLKLLLAPEFENIDGMMGALEGPDGSVLLTERNKAAMRVVKETLGKGKKNLAVFYGAAHLRDMEKRLKGMGFEPVATRWVTAWDVSAKAATTRAATTRATVKRG
jgi:hypothetical protein